jgi:hypothetical protein
MSRCNHTAAVCLSVPCSPSQVDTVHNKWDGASYLYNNIIEAFGVSRHLKH